MIDSKLLTVVNAIKCVTDLDIRVDTRKRNIVYLKKIYYKIVKSKTNCSAKKMANFVHTQNHATTLFHLKTVDRMLDTKPEYRKIYDEVLLLTKDIKPDEVTVKDKVIEVVKEIQYVNIPVDIYDTGIPRYIIDHLVEYSESELNDLFETRLKPYKKFLDIKRTNTIAESTKVKHKRFKTISILH